jgi:DNA-binding transcriptional ArsR family regulator
VEASAGTEKSLRRTQESLAALVSHPLRAKCWTVVADRPVSPRELSSLLGEPLARVAYHVRELRDAGVIELCKEEPRRGSTEHWYRAVVRPFLDDEGTALRSVPERNEYARFILQHHFADATFSLDEGLLGKRHDHWIVRFPMQVDEEGWRELNDAYDELTNRIIEAQTASAQRAAEAEDKDSPSIRVSAFATYFEMPQPKELP